MKKINVLFVLVLVALVFLGCSTIKGTASGMYPVRQIEMTDLPAEYYDFLGTVSSSVDVDLKYAEEFDINKYATLDLFEGGNILLPPVLVNMEDPMAVGIANGLAVLVEEADKLDASFIAYPKYSITYNKGVATILFRAVAVKVRNPQ